jgi:SAM-dependent methyltransferase
VSDMPSELDEANRLAWGSRDVRELFVEREGFTDQAEAHLMRHVATEARDQPLLDIGVGGGRTVSFLQAVSGDYVAIDYLEDLVSATRLRYPGVRVEHMDARDLSAFADGSFALVVFSCNGIDGVPHTDRETIFNEVRRVLRPGGRFAYSTHNLDYRARRPQLDIDGARIVRHPARALRNIARAPKMIRDYRRLLSLDVRGEGWATLATVGYGFAVAWHYVTLAEALRELRESGFTATDIFGLSRLITTIDASSVSADRLAAGVDTSRFLSHHLLAHTPA